MYVNNSNGNGGGSRGHELTDNNTDKQQKKKSEMGRSYTVCTIWVSNGGQYEEYWLLDCDAVCSGR